MLKVFSSEQIISAIDKTFDDLEWKNFSSSNALSDAFKKALIDSQLELLKTLKENLLAEEENE